MYEITAISLLDHAGFYKLTNRSLLISRLWHRRNSAARGRTLLFKYVQSDLSYSEYSRKIQDTPIEKEYTLSDLDNGTTVERFIEGILRSQHSNVYVLPNAAAVLKVNYKQPYQQPSQAYSQRNQPNRSVSMPGGPPPPLDSPVPTYWAPPPLDSPVPTYWAPYPQPYRQRNPPNRSVPMPAGPPPLLARPPPTKPKARAVPKKPKARAVSKKPKTKIYDLVSKDDDRWSRHQHEYANKTEPTFVFKFKDREQN